MGTHCSSAIGNIYDIASASSAISPSITSIRPDICFISLGRVCFKKQGDEMRNALILLMTILLSAIYACSESESPVDTNDLSIIEREAIVSENCLILQTALDEYVAHNDGICPADIYVDTNSMSHTVIDLLPDGQPLVNPFTELRTEPRNSDAVEPGQIGYSQSYYYESLYNISGYGANSVILELSNLEELEQKVIANCMYIRNAAEMFASLNDGEVPRWGTDTTPQGMTLIDLLPEGRHLRNPFTRLYTEPIDGMAANPGEAGYSPVSDGGQNVGYTISGNGVNAGTRIFLWWQTPSDTMIVVYGVEVYSTE